MTPADVWAQHLPCARSQRAPGVRCFRHFRRILRSPRVFLLHMLASRHPASSASNTMPADVYPPDTAPAEMSFFPAGRRSWRRLLFTFG